MSHARRALVAIALGTFACGGSAPAPTAPIVATPSLPDARPPYEGSQPQAEPEAPVTPLAIADSLKCNAPPPSKPAPRPVAPRAEKNVIAGQMTELAAQAKRLYDAEKWPDAINALRMIADGRSGDDEGNRQLAAYHLAIALYRTKAYDESQRLFGEFAARPDHLKHGETLLWLGKLSVEYPGFQLSNMKLYTPALIERFRNASQQAVYWQLAYLVGRERYAEGDSNEAEGYFRRVGPESPYRQAADECLKRLGR